MSPAPQISIANSARGNGVQNFVLGVQNCTKRVQNYDPPFYIKTASEGCISPPPPQNLNCGYLELSGQEECLTPVTEYRSAEARNRKT